MCFTTLKVKQSMTSPALTRHPLRFCRQEASELSSLKPQLEEFGIPLVAVVKENIGTEIEDFRPHFAGDIYIDQEVSETPSLSKFQRGISGNKLFYPRRENTSNG